jgi:type III secretion protein N (ATPase)
MAGSAPDMNASPAKGAILPGSHALERELSELVQRLAQAAQYAQTRVQAGRLLAVMGTVIRAELPGVEVGELCEMRSPGIPGTAQAEVIGLDGEIAYLAPFGAMIGLSQKTEIIGTRRPATLEVGDHLIGAMLDGFGNPVGRYAPAMALAPERSTVRPIQSAPVSFMQRRAVTGRLSLGLRAIDGLITCVEGQRIGIFGNAGTGKSSLIGQIVNATEADLVVVALVGERGREVGGFVNEALAHRKTPSVLVASTSDRPPVERMKAVHVATTIAEHYRDLGKKVLLVVDSITRLARALREIGLAAGEPPVRRGYPPSVFMALPRIFERAGATSSGSITALYTVLVEGEISMDPIAEETKSLLDGHIILSDKLASAGHYPAIDVLASRSRLMNQATDAEHQRRANRIRELLTRYDEIELLVRVGEFRPNTDPLADEALAKKPLIDALLRQALHEPSDFAATLQRLKQLIA